MDTATCLGVAEQASERHIAASKSVLHPSTCQVQHLGQACQPFIEPSSSQGSHLIFTFQDATAHLQVSAAAGLMLIMSAPVRNDKSGAS